MEYIIRSELASILEIHNLINACHDQFSFYKGYSITHLLLEAIHDWTKALEYCDNCHCLCLDLAKAFDSVPHHWLMLKLKSLSVSGQLLEWICCFLTTRSQCVIVNGHFSEWLPVVSGVLQGSILGLLLFILYTDDVQCIVNHSSIQMIFHFIHTF